MAKKYIQAEEYAAAGYEHIRNVEDRVKGRTVEEYGVEHIYHIAVEHAVDAITYSSGEHAYDGPAAYCPADKPAAYGIYGNYYEHKRNNDKHPAPAATLQDSESRARIVDVHKLKHTRYERNRAGIKRYVHRHPVFEPLVSN